jgi:hypothetical protein
MSGKFRPESFESFNGDRDDDTKYRSPLHLQRMPASGSSDSTWRGLLDTLVVTSWLTGSTITGHESSPTSNMDCSKTVSAKDPADLQTQSSSRMNTNPIVDSFFATGNCRLEKGNIERHARPRQQISRPIYKRPFVPA